jgi:hypothetical protein
MDSVARDVVTRWGGDSALLVDGFVAVPTVFLKHFSELNPSLTPTEALFIIELMVFKWDQRAPYPSYKSLAARMGVSEVYTRKLARTLQQKGFLSREERVGATNRFDLTPLFSQLSKHLRQIRGAGHQD